MHHRRAARQNLAIPILQNLLPCVTSTFESIDSNDRRWRVNSEWVLGLLENVDALGMNGGKNSPVTVFGQIIDTIEDIVFANLLERVVCLRPVHFDPTQACQCWARKSGHRYGCAGGRWGLNGPWRRSCMDRSMEVVGQNTMSPEERIGDSLANFACSISLPSECIPSPQTEDRTEEKGHSPTQSCVARGHSRYRL